jgi:hypothetical protein
MAFLGIIIFSYSIINEYLSGVARRDLLAPCGDWIGFCVEAAVRRGATRDDILETLAMAVYMEYSRASRLCAIRGAKGQRRMTSETQDVVQPVFALRAGV